MDGNGWKGWNWLKITGITGNGWTGWKWLVMAGIGENAGNSWHEKSGNGCKWL